MVSALYESVPSNLPTDRSSRPEMRLALAETYGTLPPVTYTIGGGELHPLASERPMMSLIGRVKVKVSTFVISVCWHTLKERTEHPLEEGS